MNLGDLPLFVLYMLTLALKLNDAIMVSSSLIMLLQATLQISLSYVLVFKTGKLDQQVPWINPFVACQLVRDLLLIEERNCVTH